MSAPSRRPIDRDEDPDALRREALSTSPSGSENCLVVGLDCRSMNLYRFLRVRFPRHPHGVLRGWIAGGRIRVNGATVSDSSPLRFGDVVEIDAIVGARRRRRAPAECRILHQDAAVIAVDKPAGLSTAPERGGRRECLLERLRDEVPDGSIHLVHRIDKPCSGVVVFARSRADKRTLTAEFAARRVVKDYLALVSGHVEDAPRILDAPLAARRGRDARVVVAPGGGRPSVTLVRAILRFRGYSLIHARPLTGRTHQIRAHLRHAGHALVCDATYDGEPELRLSRLKRGYHQGRGESERPLLDRLALHAARIRFASPATGGIVDVSAPLPKDLRSALRQLQKLAATRLVPDLDALFDPPSEGEDPFAALIAEALARIPPRRDRGSEVRAPD
jgi:RluA family pseudouridine synthase